MPDQGYRRADGHPQRRAAWATRLESSPVVCGYPECDRLVYAAAALNWDGRTWHLGHGVARKYGGTGDDSTPWHATCNQRAGAGDHTGPASLPGKDWSGQR